MVQTMLKLVTSHEPIFRVASKTESMGHISVPPLYVVSISELRLGDVDQLLLFFRSLEQADRSPSFAFRRTGEIQSHLLTQLAPLGRQLH